MEGEVTAGNLLISLLLPALAIAVNPVPIIAAVTLLMTSRGQRNATAFLVTLILVMAADGLLALLLLSQRSSASDEVNGGTQLALGVIFVGLFLAQLFSKPVPPGKEPGWMKMMNKAGLGTAIVLGLILTCYSLLAVGTSTIRQAGVDTLDELLALTYFIVVSLSTVAATLILFVARPRRAAAQLARVKSWLIKHSRTILLAVFGLMGMLFTAEGLAVLLR